MCPVVGEGGTIVEGSDFQLSNYKCMYNKSLAYWIISQSSGGDSKLSNGVWGPRCSQWMSVDVPDACSQAVCTNQVRGRKQSTGCVGLFAAVPSANV